ncbi:YbhB/YbcL family Raf kinase inhibitor-like protein [Clavibacter capsici]|uniref:YbhB/YbcL family Raf kinase inhibitor-like protein n=1 Tax=Clavibacter capsici TaxID=1874630 RepID=UPI00142816E2|nr:YbhB/YbcL family Raf kinase inhibitor-like protein [Clavibacter capsici]QIS39545.1 YbhB/YbcL family Raf kinase inhibitor-like protein [Clavibacter capsici]
MTNDPLHRLPDAAPFHLTSPDFSDGAPLPLAARGASQGGQDLSPALAWTGAPAATRSYVLTAYDPDAPTGSGYWHWAVRGIPASTTSLPAGAGDPDAGLLPEGAVTMHNESREKRFAGATPPAGHGTHRYFFTVTALDVEALDVPEGATPAVLGFLMLPHVIGRAQLVGTAITVAD